MSTEKKMLAIQDLNVIYKTDLETVYAVNGVSLSLEKGGTLGLVGETGAGKTTLALTLMRLLPARPYIELSSNAKMLVEGCTGILEYERECIRLTAGKWVLRITGSGLQIGSMKDQCAVITGVIASVEYLSSEG